MLHPSSNIPSHMVCKLEKKYHALILGLTTLLLLSSSCLFGQNKQLTLGAGTAATSRILLLDENSFDENEIDAANYLEISKLSYDLSAGFNYSINEKHQFKLGISHRWLKFGTRIYNVPDSIFSPTDAFRIKENIRQMQFFTCFQYAYSPNILSKRMSFFLGSDLVFNYADYVIGTVDYDANNNPSFVGKAGGDVTVFHPVDIRLSIGGDLLVWNQNRQTILIQLFFGVYTKPYNVFSSQRAGYLPFKKYTNGMVWDSGIKLIYAFQLGKTTTPANID